MQAAITLSCEVGKKPACEALAVPRATFYRHIDADPKPIAKRPPAPSEHVNENETPVDVN